MIKNLTFITIFLFLSTSLSARTITVTSGADSGTGTLRQAVTNADNGDVIVFAPNVTTVYFAGIIHIDKNITINGNATNNTTFQNAPVWTDNVNKKRYFDILENTEVTFNHLTLKDNWADCNGGAIANWGKLILYNCTFSNNGGKAGGAIANVGVLIVENCIFENNYATSGPGGALSVGGTSEIKNSRFSGNYSVNGGGAIQNAPNFGDDSSHCVIDNCIFYNNSALYEGAVINARGSIRITNSTFQGNRGQSTFSNAMGDATIINCLFIENGSSEEVILNYWGPQSVITAINTTVTNNTGRGLQLEGQNNTVNLYNSIIAGNLGNDVSLFNGNVSNFNVFNSLIGTTSKSDGYGNNSIIDFNGNNNIIGENPLFVGNGDYSLQESSPAINAGNNSFLSAEITKDLADNPRIKNNTVDMGAYEYQQGTAAVDNVWAEKEKTVSGYYSILGQKLPKEPTSGPYIILYNDGSAKKVFGR